MNLSIKKVVASRTTTASAFVHLCALIARPRMYDEDPSKALLELIKDYAEEALDFIKQYKLFTARQYKKLTNINAKNFWDLEYELFVDDETDSLSWNYYYNKKARSSPDLSKAETTFLNYWSQYMRNEESPTGQKAMKAIMTSVGKICPSIAQFYSGTSSTVKDQKVLLKKIQQVVKDLTGTPADLLTIDQVKQARTKDPIAYAKYLALRRQSTAITKDIMIDLLRTNGRMKISDLIKHLDNIGVSYTIPHFNGLIDEQGYYTIYGEKLEGTPVGEVLTNPKYKKGSSEYVLKYKAPGAKTYQSVYTLYTKEQNKESKFNAVYANLDKLEKARKKWSKDVLNQDERAIITEIMFLTQARVGTVGNKTDGVPTYGISTLLAKHIRVKGNTAYIKYKGKKGQIQSHIIEGTNKVTKSIVDYLADAKDTLEPDDYIFSPTGSDINNYLKSLGLSITVHKFRTLHGTLLMREQLDEIRETIGKRSNAKTILKAFNDAALNVGKMLGHFNNDGTKITATTAIANYIDPNIMIDFFDEYNIQLPAVLQKHLKSA